MIMVKFYFLNLFLNNKLVYCRIFTTVFNVVIEYFLKPILKLVRPKWKIYEDFKYWICALAEQICTVKNVLYVSNDFNPPLALPFKTY